MKDANSHLLTEEEKRQYTDALTECLPELRSKLRISQSLMADLIGISRQTYGAIERKKHPLSWNTFLALILFLDHNEATHHILRQKGLFPDIIFLKKNKSEAVPEADMRFCLRDTVGQLTEVLDEQALLSIRAMIYTEYIRCAGFTGDALHTALDSIAASAAADKKDERTRKTYQALNDKEKDHN